ncbi:MAG: type IV pilin, partial [Haloarculaceae archaeon]
VPQLTVAEALDLAEERSDLDPRRMNELLAFGSVATGDGALLVRTDFTDAEVTELVETSVDVTDRTYRDRTVYASGNGSQLAVLGDGQYVLGTPAAIERVVDVQHGDVEPVNGEARTAYDAARGGYMRFAFDIPPERVPGSGGQAAAAARGIEYGYGSLYREDQSLLLSLTARSEDEESAELLRTQLEEGIGAVRAELDRVERPQLRSRLERLLTKTDLSRDGRTVTVRNSEGGVAVATAVAAVVVSFVLGLGEEPVAAPQAAFAFDYDRAAEQLTVQHRAGDNIAATRLSVEGRGLDATGPWAALGGETSGDIGDQPALQAGDALTLGARPDYELSLVWTAADGSTSQVLSTDTGPDA